MLGIRNFTTKLDILHFISITFHLLTRYMCLFVILLNTFWLALLDHNVELQTCLQLFNNITNKHIYRVNKWNVIDMKCKISSFVVKFRIPSITINNLFVRNYHFIKIDAQNFGYTTDRKLYLIWAITVIIPWYWDYRKRLIIIS